MRKMKTRYFLTAGVVALGVGVAMTGQPARPAWLPDPVLTPGAVYQVDPDQLFAPGYAASVRNVSDRTKREVYRRYGVTPDSSKYEVDHLIPLLLGGSNSISNLWPMPYDGQYGAREKDRLEVRMLAELRRGTVDLPTAQGYFRGDWTVAYKRFILKH